MLADLKQHELDELAATSTSDGRWCAAWSDYGAKSYGAVVGAGGRNRAPKWEVSPSGDGAYASARSTVASGMNLMKPPRLVLY